MLNNNIKRLFSQGDNISTLESSCLLKLSCHGITWQSKIEKLPSSFADFKAVTCTAHPCYTRITWVDMEFFLIILTKQRSSAAFVTYFTLYSYEIRLSGFLFIISGVV